MYIYIYKYNIICIESKHLVCNLMNWYKCTTTKYVLILSNVF